MPKYLLPLLAAISILAATIHFKMAYCDHERQFNLDLQSEINVTAHTKWAVRFVPLAARGPGQFSATTFQSGPGWSPYI
jgi:hypothetical protein